MRKFYHGSPVEFLRAKGYPLKIIGNGGYPATLCDIQPLNGDYEAVYRYPGGEATHDLQEITAYFKVVEK